VQKPKHGLVGIQSKFEEDVYLGKHTSVWGSFYDIATKKWGFKCCMTFNKDQIECLGEKSRSAYLKHKSENAF
jgi:hypothetical protein